LFQDLSWPLHSTQGRVSECKRKVEALNRRVESSQKETQDMSGKYEYADDMGAKRDSGRRAIEDYNKAIQELELANKHLQGAIQEIGGRYRVVENNETYTVMDNEKQELEPIVTKARPSYERSTKSYRTTEE